MNFDIREAQPKVWELLAKIIDNAKVGSAYLFAGPSGVGKEAMAIEFGAVINSQYFKSDAKVSEDNYNKFKNLQHELLKLVFTLPASSTKKDSRSPLDSLKESDLQLLNELIGKKVNDPFQKLILPGATRILISSIRELRKKLYLKSDDVGRKIVVIFDAHLLSAGQAESANALLKILEEPPQNTTIILVTDNKDQLLPTILSRCQHIDFPPFNNNTIKEFLFEQEINGESIDIVVELAGGDMRNAISIARKPVADLINTINELSEVVLDENGNEWRKFIEDNSKLSRTDKNQFQFNLFLLQNWFKNIYHFRLGMQNKFYHPQLLDKMEQFNKEYPNANLTQINILIEEAIESVGRNLYMSLTLTNLLINIHRNLR